MHSGPDDSAPLGTTAEARLVSPDGNETGTVTLTQGPNGVLLVIEVQGLPPGGHAVSINSVGAFAPDFRAAGDHFSPHGGDHGFLKGNGPHIGDLLNIYTAVDASVRADLFTAGLTLDSGTDHSLFDEDGSSIVIHEKPDDYIGIRGLGNRVVCGVIQGN